MIRSSLVVLIICLLLSGCVISDKVEFLTKAIVKIEDGNLYFDCSEERIVSQGDTINDIAYRCPVVINEETTITDERDHPLLLDELKVEDLIKIYLSKPLKIDEMGHEAFEAKKIVRIESHDL